MLPLEVVGPGGSLLMLLFCHIIVERRQSESVLVGGNGDGARQLWQMMDGGSAHYLAIRASAGAELAFLLHLILNYVFFLSLAFILYHLTMLLYYSALFILILFVISPFCRDFELFGLILLLLVF